MPEITDHILCTHRHKKKRKKREGGKSRTDHRVKVYCSVHMHAAWKTFLKLCHAGLPCDSGDCGWVTSIDGTCAVVALLTLPPVCPILAVGRWLWTPEGKCRENMNLINTTMQPVEMSSNYTVRHDGRFRQLTVPSLQWMRFLRGPVIPRHRPMVISFSRFKDASGIKWKKKGGILYM